jgi:predicted transposase YdaD
MDVLQIRGIEESSIYREIFHKGRRVGKAEGKVEGARDTILRLGTRKLGPPPRRSRPNWRRSLT